jgi:hypothetical protein
VPGYQSGQSGLLRKNRQVFLFNNESVGSGVSSMGVQLERISNSSYPWGAAFQVKFSGAPGVFQIDVQASETDVDGDYIPVASLTAVTTNNSTRFDMTNLFPKFVRVNIVTLTNSVNTTVILSH